MLTYREKVRHFWQDGRPNCGPIALACIFNASIEELERIVKCTGRGTHSSNVYAGMQNEGIECNLISLFEDHSDHIWWLETSSHRWPIYVGCEFRNQGSRGRPTLSRHAVLFANGMCYDGHNMREEPIETIITKFNKTFVIRDVIIFNHELVGWKNNTQCEGSFTAVL